jgi:hypothetical protein
MCATSLIRWASTTILFVCSGFSCRLKQYLKNKNKNKQTKQKTEVLKDHKNEPQSIKKG